MDKKNSQVMNQPIISIIIAAYNAASFISRLLESIPNSSFLEIIVVNDGSSDSTAEIVSRMALADRKIRLVNQKNAGVSAARNHGIREAKGKWLMFADADDWYDDEHLKMLVKHLGNIDAGIDIVTFGVKHVFPQKVVEHPVSEQILTTRDFLQEGLFVEASWNYAFRHDIIEKYQIRFPEGIINTEDQNFNLKAIVSSGKIASFNLVVYNYNKTNDSSASSKKHKKEWTEAPLLSAIDLTDFCRKHHLQIELIKGNLAHLLYQFLSDCSSNITLSERSNVYRKAYRKICSVIPSFKGYKKYLIPYYSMALGMFLFKNHEKIKKYI